MISHEKKFVFVHIPRTGGTKLSEILRPHCDEESLCFSPFEEGGHLHATLVEYVRHYGLDILEYTLFTIIRNPWDRILSKSMKHNNGVFDKEHFQKTLLSPWNLGLFPHSHFNYFLSQTFEAGDRRKGWQGAKVPHLNYVPAIPPEEIWQLERQLYWPYFLQFENYAKEVSFILDKLEIPHDEESLKKKSNTTTHKHYSHYYNDDERDHVIQSCGLDLQLFGYTFEDRRKS